VARAGVSVGSARGEGATKTEDVRRGASRYVRDASAARTNFPVREATNYFWSRPARSSRRVGICEARSNFRQGRNSLRRSGESDDWNGTEHGTIRAHSQKLLFVPGWFGAQWSAGSRSRLRVALTFSASRSARGTRVLRPFAAAVPRALLLAVVILTS
jgi:hypothetical protein